MSWLLAACIPTLLMVSTFGLQRLENGLTSRLAPADAVERAEEAARVEQAARAERVAREALTAPKPAHSFKLNSEEPGLPTREHPREYALEYSMARPNPQFHRTRSPNPV